jgi:hypothetical protein
VADRPQTPGSNRRQVCRFVKPASRSAAPLTRLLPAQEKKFYAHYINSEAMTQLEKLEQQNISHLGITPGELEKIMLGTAEILAKNSITEMVDEAVSRAKNFPPKKSVEMVLSVCEDILCKPIDGLSAEDRNILLGVLARYTVMKRQYAEQERMAAKSKKRDTHERER